MRTATLVSIVLLAAVAGTTSADVSLSSLNDFSVDSEGWSVGIAGIDPTRNSGTSFDGQPGFLSHFSDGSFTNGKFVMFSVESDWRGNYTAAGVTGISLWADNRAGAPLDLRIAFNGPGGWFYTDAQTITNSTGGDDWTHLVYDITSLNYVGSGGTGVFADTMAGVTRFEIFGGDNPVIIGGGGALIHAGPSDNTIAIDHIQAVPEPSSILLLLFGGAGFALLATKRKRER